VRAGRAAAAYLIGWRLAAVHARSDAEAQARAESAAQYGHATPSGCRAEREGNILVDVHGHASDTSVDSALGRRRGRLKLVADAEAAHTNPGWKLMLEVFKLGIAAVA
jgi:hypothetical protein